MAVFIHHLTSQLFCRSLSETYTQGTGEEKEREKLQDSSSNPQKPAFCNPSIPMVKWEAEAGESLGVSRPS